MPVPLARAGGSEGRRVGTRDERFVRALATRSPTIRSSFTRPGVEYFRKAHTHMHAYRFLVDDGEPEEIRAVP